MKPFFFAFSASCLALLGAAVVPGTPRSAADHAKKRVPTFAKDIAPIIYSKCAPCHHAGEVAPFNLTSYEDAKSKAPTLAAVAKSKYMPPWQAVSHGEFSNERQLTAEQIETLNEWAADGAPSGDLSHAPKPPTYTVGWGMGTPDYIGQPVHEYALDAEGPDEYRCFVIPTNFGEDRFVTSVELRPGNRRIVHHALIYLDTSGVARKKDGKDGKLGYASTVSPGFQSVGEIGVWVPGMLYQTLPKGDGFLLPKGADIVLQVHYHKDGKPETDLTKLGLRFASGPVDKHVRWEPVGTELLSIQPGDSHYEAKSKVKLNTDITLIDVFPHMHVLGHDMLVNATLPNGTKMQLVNVQNYDFSWQTRYIYKQPIHLPKGTEISLVAHFDNSPANLHNPTIPPKKVLFGEQTTNEMCYAFFNYTCDSEHLTKGIKARVEEGLQASQPQMTLTQIFTFFDANHDGSLDTGELTDVMQFVQTFIGDPAKKPRDPRQAATFLIGSYGKTEKGKLNKDEFVKLFTALQAAG